jgi:hypothetical protein
VSELLASLQREQPRLVATLRSGTALRLATWLAARRVDAALTCIQASAPAARVLHRKPFVERGHCEIMDSGRELVRYAGVKLDVVARVHSDDLALALVAQGLGYPLAPLGLADGLRLA